MPQSLPFVRGIFQPSLTVADLLLRSGDQQAEAERRRGEIAAQMWTGLGNTIARVPMQIQDMKTQAIANEGLKTRNALESLQLDRANQDKADRQSLDTAMSPRATMGPGFIGPIQEGTPSPTRQQVLDALPGHLRPVVEKHYQDADEAALKVQELKDKTTAAETSYFAQLGSSVHAMSEHGPAMMLATAQEALKHAADHGYSKQASDLAQQIQQNPSPDALDALAKSLMSKDEKFAALLKKPDVKTVKIETIGPDGKPQIQLVEDKPGQTFAVPPKETTPRPITEQLLEAVANGDTTKVNQIKQTIQTEAMARRDPATAALANEIGNLRKDEARARLDVLQKKSEPLDVSPDVQTTVSGKKYIDLSKYAGEDRNKARDAANASGVIAVSKEQADAVQQIDNARMNQRDIMGQISDLLPKDASGRPLATASTALGKLFQTNDQVAAFGSWRTAAINTLRATAGSKGLRITGPEIAQAIENDIPKLTDTIGTAQQKIKNINTLLDNAEKPILTKDRSQSSTPTEGTIDGVTFKVRPPK